MFSLKFLQILLILSFVYCVFTFRKQGVGVKGKLLCDGKPLHNAKVKIFDVDRSKQCHTQDFVMGRVQDYKEVNNIRVKIM